MRRSSRSLTLATHLAVVAACIPVSGEEYARRHLPKIEFTEVLAQKQSYWDAYGCTYVVVRLAADSPDAPPTYEGVLWQPTPVAPGLPNDRRMECLTNKPNGWTGSGLDGYGNRVFESLQIPGAWAARFGGSESQILLVYAPAAGIASYLR